MRIIRKLFDRTIGEKLESLSSRSPVIKLNDEDRLVIFSDLHMGGGGKNDDFESNGPLFEHILANHYLKNDFKLILNGDIDELLRFSERAIVRKWKNIFDLFARFNEKNDLIKIIGNHDIELKKRNQHPPDMQIHESVKLDFHGNRIMIFHGHQAGCEFNYNPMFTRAFLRFFAAPLGIRNYTVANNSRKKYVIEKRIYDFSKKNRLVSIIGHTHRPLFESMSKKDNLRFGIEKYCRIYPGSTETEKKRLEKKIRLYKKELLELIGKNHSEGYIDTLYNTEPFVPCMFNSGSGVGKRGITSIEISEGKIRLIYWFDRSKTEKYFDFNGHRPVRLGRSDYYRVPLKEESLDYLFTRLKLLS